jgi:atypical dual specificity phosphatase
VRGNAAHMVPNFGFVLEGKLAGCAHPGRWNTLRETLSELTEQQQITAMVTLTEEPLEKDVLEEYGIAWLHLPVADFCVPDLEAAEEAVHFVTEEIRHGGRVVVHCHAGYGRTGTFLACCLVAEGYAPEKAIDLVRAARPGSLETNEQEAFVHRWAAWRNVRKDEV